MRLDKFLQVSRLVKRRTIANTLCSKGAVSVNGHVAKAGKMLVVGDVIRLPGPAPSAAEVHPADIWRFLNLNMRFLNYPLETSRVPVPQHSIVNYSEDTILASGGEEHQLLIEPLHRCRPHEALTTVPKTEQREVWIL